MKSLRHPLVLALAIIAASGRAQAATQTYDFSVGESAGLISDQGVPSTFTQRISGSGIDILTEVRIALHLVGDDAGGGWAGDMFVSLSRNGVETSILLNQPGVTSATPEGSGFDGWDILLRDSAPNGDIHLGEPSGSDTILTGDWQPDGRQDPLSSTRSAKLSVFNSTNPNTDWHLTIADLNPTGEMVLESWSLILTGTAVVPEPGAWTAISAISLAAFAAWRRGQRGVKKSG